MQIHLEVLPLDRTTGVRIPVRLCSADDRRITAFDGYRWWPAITRKPTMTMTLFDGAFTGSITTGEARVEISAYALKRCDSLAPGYAWTGAPVKFWSIIPETGERELRFVGLIEQMSNSGDAISINMRVDTEPFVLNVLPLTYAGTGAAEGPADLKDKIKPFVIGRCFNIEPAQINVPLNIYQFHGYGPISAIETLYERGSVYGDSSGDHANYAALAAAELEPGTWATCLAEGMIRLGAPAFGVITADVLGDQPASIGARKTGEVITRLCEVAGISTDVLDLASLSALDAALSSLPSQGHIGLYLNDQVRGLELFQTLARPCNAAVGISWLGKLFVARTRFGTPATVFDAQGRRRPAVLGAAEQSVSPPFWRIEMLGQRSWRVHNDSEISWGALNAEEIVYPDGTPVSDLQPGQAGATRNVARGFYNSGTAYTRGDEVIFNGATYRLIVATSTGVTPGDATKWAQVSVAGNIFSVVSSGQAFTFDGNGNAVPSSQSIDFTAYAPGEDEVTWAAVAYGAAGTSLGAATLTGSGLSRALSLANFIANSGTVRVVVTAEYGDLTDSVTIVRLQNGVSPITGYLTNEAVTLPADAAGSVPSFAGASGLFKVFEGVTPITSGVTYSVEGSSAITVTISASGAYEVTAMDSQSYGAATLRAVYQGVTIDRVFWVSKALAGTSSSVLTLSAPAQAFTFDGGGAAAPTSQSIVFTANRQNLTGTVVWTARAFNAAGADIGAATLTGSGDTRTLSLANFQANSGTQSVTVTATLGGLSDSMTVYRLADGAAGLTGLLSNEAVTLSAAADGTVSDFSPASGQFRLFRGTTDVTTSGSFSVFSQTSCSVSINPISGAYSVASMSADTATATLRATISGATIDLVLSLAKARRGVTGDPGATGAAAQALLLTTSGTAFSFNGVGDPSPSSQSITLNVNRQNISGTVTFSAQAYASNGSLLGNVSLSGSGDSRTISNTQFSTYTGTAFVQVIASLGALSDSATLIRVVDGSPAINSVLTNESHSVTTAVDGTGGVFTDAGGTMRVFRGAADITTGNGVSYSIASRSPASPTWITIDALTGVYTVSDPGANQAAATVRATLAGINYDRTYTLAKSRAGEAGITGSLDRDNAVVPARADGVVESYALATAAFRAFRGLTDVSNLFTLSVVSNPQTLTVSISGQTFSVTAGFDANEDTATITVRATGSGAMAGVFFDRTFSLGKSRNGVPVVSVLPSTDLFVGRQVFLTTDGKTYRNTDATFAGWTAGVAAPDVSGSLSTIQISTNAISNITVSDSTTALNIAHTTSSSLNDWTLIQSVTFTTTGGVLLFDANFVNSSQAPANSTDLYGIDFALRTLTGGFGTQIHQSKQLGHGAAVPRFFDVCQIRTTTILPAGTYTAELRARFIQPTGGAGTTTANRTIVVTELKR